MKIRKANLADLPAFLQIKSALRMPDAAETAEGGFLLGTDADTYAFYITHAHCLVAEHEGSLRGFGIMLPDEMLKQSELWEKRRQVDWQGLALEQLEQQSICYFDQLAFLPQQRRLAPVLGYWLLRSSFEQGHQAMFATTVRKPVRNMAAVPFILDAGGRCVGHIDEVYPEIGQLLSDIYYIEASVFFEKVKTLSYLPFLEKFSL